jgi:hypothetical protein
VLRQLRVAAGAGVRVDRLLDGGRLAPLHPDSLRGEEHGAVALEADH